MSRSGSKVAPRLAALMLVALLFAGCVEGEKTEDVDPVDAPHDDVVDPALLDGARDLRYDLEQTDELPAPTRRVGDHFTFSLTFGSGDGSDVEAVVTTADATGHTLATSDQGWAKWDAVHDLFFLGAVGADLSMTGQGGKWGLFSFPLADGLTWQGEMPNIAFDVIDSDTVPIDLQATYMPGLDVLGTTLPGYTVVGHHGTDKLIEFDYAPAVGWFTRLTVYDIDPGQDPLEIQLALKQYGRDWNGTLYVETASLLVNNLDASGLSAPPTEGGVPVVKASPTVTFTVPADAHHLVGRILQVAVAGARATFLITPEDQVRETHVVGAPEEGKIVTVDEPAIAGEWRIVTAGAGAFNGCQVVMWSLVESTITL